MTHLVNDPADFADEALDGLVAANHRYLRKIHGGVVRSTRVDEGQVAVIVGGGTGHYPAFAGWVGPGLAHGAACGNIFSSPSASQVYSVMKAAHRGAGVFVSFGNYAGDVLHFGQAAQQLRSEGVDVRILTVTDDLASAPAERAAERRGIAGDLAVFKVAGAAAEAAYDLDAVETVARKANDRTRTLGVAFSGCTLPGADHPLFEVPDGTMSIGLGIHGEPGIADVPMPKADAIAEMLVERVLAEAPANAGTRVTVLFNGLGTVKYEELFVGYRRVNQLLTEAGYQIVDPEVGEQCTSLDMAGLSLTLMWLDEELERLWTAPCDTPALRRGAMAARELREDEGPGVEADDVPEGSPESQAAAADIAAALADVHSLLIEQERYLGEIDAVAGDGDHGIGMLRGARAADETAASLRDHNAGASTLVNRAGAAWAERAGGTSGALWGAAFSAVSRHLDDTSPLSPDLLGPAAAAAVQAILDLGGAQVGDKTMVDAAEPFRAQVATMTGADRAVWDAAVEAARAGAESTKSLVAKRGRAKTHAEHSLGTPDPGAISFVAILDTLTPHLFPQER